MLKKSLLAMAAIGAFAGSAVAADVTLYGLVDYGFNYQHRDIDIQGYDDSDGFEMRSGQNSGSRFGLKGTEDLGNGLTVGFVLENGFEADTGSLGNGSRLFGCEAQVYLKGDFGTLSMGRVGQFASANGSFGLLGKASPFSGGWGDSVGAKFMFANGYDRFDNTITYVTPDFAGLKVHAQYSLKTNSKDAGEESKTTANRYYAVAATYENEALYLVGVVDSINYSTTNNYIAGSTNPEDDQWTFTLGGHYDFGGMTLYGLGQYFKNASAIGQKGLVGTTTGSVAGGPGYTMGEFNGANGYGLTVGVGVPVLGGTAKASLGYMDAEADRVGAGADGKAEINRWNLSVGYDYSLSKRTSVYSAVAYQRDDVDYKVGDSFNPSTVEVLAGLIHKF